MIYGSEEEEEEDLSVFVTKLYRNAGLFNSSDKIDIYGIGKKVPDTIIPIKVEMRKSGDVYIGTC